MKAVFFEVEDWQKDYLKEKLEQPKGSPELSFFAEPLSSENIDSALGCQIISPFIYSHINKDILLKLPEVKRIATMATVFCRIYFNSSKEKKIVVGKVPFCV